ncbi:MAG: GNAT family N-acetyltransferase [Eubacteriales bacterium]|nr:GNAT family N-acetyltransferase [Eubacteriales bacterium]
MIVRLTENNEDKYTKSENIAVYSDDGITRKSSAGIKTCQSRYDGNYIKTMTIGGIGTAPEFRREGCVRRIFDELFNIAPERGWIVSMLHPFSFSYYRKFGYEKICDHRILEFPITKLDFVPRCTDVQILDNDRRLADAIDIYNKFADNRNIMFRRYDSAHFSKEPNKNGKSTYIHYNSDGKPVSYITLGVENVYYVNRMKSINLNVYEMAFVSRESLAALFGFMRMYEGENDTVKIHNCGMSPEIDVMLRHYIHTEYTLVPDIMARILDVKTILELNRYPEEAGCFTIKVDDTLEYTRGTYHVEYADGKAEVEKVTDAHKYDIKADMPAFTQMIYGYDSYNADIACYMHGVDVKNDCNDFFRAFTKKSNGLFEHF